MALTLIRTLTVGAGGASAIDFTAIPQTFADIKIVLSARNSAINSTDVYAQFNGVTTSTYSMRRLYGTGSGAGNADNAGPAATGFRIGRSSDSNYTANTFSNSTLYIPNYAGNSIKNGSSEQVEENNNTTALQLLTGVIWSGTAAITQVTLKQLDGNNFAQGTTASLYGVSKTINLSGAKATGGMITFAGGYAYHMFSASGTFTPTTSLTADMLIIGGGGAGGGDWNFAQGGGGAGGVVYLSGQSLTATPYTVTVGAGGASGYAVTNNGSNSSINGFTTAIGGGGGGAYNSSSGVATNGGNGGSGGGKNFYSGSAGTGTAGQGFNGGNSTTIGGNFAGGGGGGAVSAGGGGTGGSATSAYSVWAAATNTGVGGAYAGGGAGSVYGATPAGGGGGAGGSGGYTNGAPATGSGGGGNATGGGTTFAGGSGIVIVRYSI